MQSRILISFLLIIGFSISSNAQSLKKYQRLIGIWEYQNQAGFEIWKKESQGLSGSAYRIQNGRDTVQIESMRIVSENGQVVLYFKSMNALNSNEIRYTESSDKRYKFVNEKHDFPKSIYYKFRFFSRKKASVILNHPHEDDFSKPIVMVKKNS